MEKLIHAAFETAESLGVKAEVRFSSTEEELIRVKGFETEIAGYEHTSGLGVTVYASGSYGFCSTSVLEPEEARRAVQNAYSIARERASQRRHQIIFPELPAYRDSRTSNFRIDPFSIKPEEKVEFLLKVNESAYRHAGNVQIIPVSIIRSIKKYCIYANTSGAYIEQTLISCGAEAQIYAFSDRDMQVRSFPSRDASYYQKGYEVVSELGLSEGVAQAVEEAIALLKARECEPGYYDAVISQDQMSLQIHESIGHPSELDRALGYEISLAGASFLTPESIGKFVLGSEKVNLISDATLENALGSFFYDDEGTKADSFYVVENGIFKNFLTSRESALALGMPSNGCARAESALKFPIVRMTNLYLEPDCKGPSSLEEMISEIKKGIYLKTTRSWSIDDLRLNFQFAVECAREIKNGRLGRYLKNVNYTGITPHFWRNVAVIGNSNTFEIYGFLNCGKGDPIQLASVGHGSPLVMVRNLQVGVAR